MYFHFTWKYSVLYFLFIPFIFVKVALDLILEDFHTLWKFVFWEKKNDFFISVEKLEKKLFCIFLLKTKQSNDWKRTIFSQIDGK